MTSPAQHDNHGASHTPGPWEACDPGDYADFDGDSRVILGDDRRIAVVHWKYEPHGGDTECDANARLIAAAPELLAALAETWRVLRAAGTLNLTNGVQLGQTSWYVKICDAERLSDAAIAKALGQ